MSYTTPAAMVQCFGAQELAQVCDRDHAPFLVTPELFQLAADDGDLSGEPADVQAVVAAALERCQAKIDRATGEMDSYLVRAQTLPLSQAVIDANDIAGKCADLARCKLHDDGRPEHIENACKEVRSWLKDVAAGRAMLLNPDAPTASNTNRVRHGQAVSGFDWGGY